MLNQKSQVTGGSPCARFGLDIKKLQVEELLKIRTYRRLFNIVAYDQTSSKYEFRPHLIKELYFLLQITPFIDATLQEEFLEKIQEWYNSNDHKKINLSKNLQNIVGNICKGKSKSRIATKTYLERPKTGVVWDTSINSFLRPYTAKLRKNSLNKLRPDSAQNSTTALTNFSKNFVDSMDKGENNDMEQQWVRSQDFKQKFRTLHPEEEPTYQKLMNLITRADNNQYYEDINLDLLSDKRSSPSIQKKIFSSGLNISNSNYLRESLNKSKAQVELLSRENREFVDEVQEQANFGLGEEGDGEQSQEQEEIDMNQKKLSYAKDSRSRRNILFKDRLMGMKVFSSQPPKQNDPYFKLYKMNLMENQNKVISRRQDDQYLYNHISYTKQKTFMRREFARKTSSKRLFTNIKETNEVKSKLNNFFSASKETQNKPISPHVLKVDNFEQVEQLPYYHAKQFFQGKVQNSLKEHFKIIKKQDEESRPKSICTLTKHQRFLSEKKFDPLHQDNLVDYNKKTIEDIMKIKEKTEGNNNVCTDMLMKALYIGTPASAEQNSWSKFDKKYLMIQKEPNKKPKKRRNLKKKYAKKGVR